MRPRDRISDDSEAADERSQSASAPAPSVAGVARSVSEGAALSPAQVQGLSRSAGNAAVARMAEEGAGHGSDCGCNACG